MFENFRKKIAHVIIKKKFISKNLYQINFNNELKNSKNYFLVLPQTENEIYESQLIIDYLVTKDKSITFFAPIEFRKLIDKYENITLLSFHEKSKTYFFLPNKNYIKKLSQLNFDVVIDFNRMEDVFMSAVSNIVNSKIKIGFKKNNSEKYYNFLIENKSNDIKMNYLNLLNTLKMF